MRLSRNTLSTAAAATFLLLLPALTLGAEEPVLDGKKLFVETHKCNMCHSVPAAEIEAKTKAASMKGADLGGKIEVPFEKVAAYVRKEAVLDDAKHKKEFKGTDEELQAIIDWLGSLEAQE